MSENMYEFLVMGSTGLCGGSFVKYLNKYVQTTSQKSILNTIIRKPYQDAYLKQHELGNEGLTKIYFSGLGTTRADAGGLENQKKIDLDLNYELAKAAKEKGFKTCVLVSSGGANADSMLPYLKMKGELEEKLKALNFDNLIILRPGALLGDRLNRHKGFGNSAFAYLGSMVYGTWFSKYLGYPVYGDEVGKAGVTLALKAASEKTPLGVKIYNSNELIQIAKD
ncbi:hypothetical protein ACO0SA_004859 [Hanseniaspora valbyensis]